MALADGCLFVAGSSGTSDFSDGDAVVGFRNMEDTPLVNGAVYGYRAESADQIEWEIGRGTYDSSSGVLERTSVSASSNEDSAVDFSDPPIVGITPLAEDIEERAAKSANLSDLANVLTARTNLKMVTLTQAAYDALDPPDSDTLYFITA